jgi:predicted GIY-YIG superfamily endonuclease
VARKTVDFTKGGISALPDDKPVIYTVLTDGNKNNYTGVAKRGRVQERIAEHLPGAMDAVPGTKVRIEQMKSIERAEAKESLVIARSNPKYNTQGK